MSTVEKALETQLQNIQSKTGQTLEQLYARIQQSGFTAHGEIRDMLKRELGLGHGDANTLTTFYRKAAQGSAAQATPPSSDAALDEIYAKGRAALRPIHEALMDAITPFGPFEIAPKKGYVSLRRKKQFAMLGPGSQTRVDVGLNMKDVAPTPRLVAMPAGGMCQYKVSVSSIEEVDAELLAWLQHAYDAAK